MNPKPPRTRPRKKPSPEAVLSSSAPWHLYIARCSDGSLYTGIAKDVPKRLEAHNAGKGAKYTRTRAPLTLLLEEPQASYSTALRREYQVKRLGRLGKEAFIAGKVPPPPGDDSKMSFQKKRRKKKRRKARRSRKHRRSRSGVSRGVIRSRQGSQGSVKV